MICNTNAYLQTLSAATPPAQLLNNEVTIAQFPNCHIGYNVPKATIPCNINVTNYRVLCTARNSVGLSLCTRCALTIITGATIARYQYTSLVN